jgi:eukaryotic-like serine/threonine-protein kinase
MTDDRWPEVERLCLAAIERDPAARAAFLDEACAGDQDLRREVDSLLEHESAGDDLLAVPPIEIAAAAMAERDKMRPSGAKSGGSALRMREPLPTGTRLGRYEIETLLGAGGMGDVYRALDTRLGREVAVKVLPPEFAADPDRLPRFELEARAVAALHHPNILAIHDVGVSPAASAGSTGVTDPADAAPMHYLVTELLEGETLRERLAQGPLPVAAALDVSLQVAKALAAAHGRHIVHRDLKPSNVFLTRDGPVKLLDFGIAKVLAPGAADEAGHMIAGVPVAEMSGRAGTVGYMSPEQVMGLPTDARSDIFSFGAVLYEMLTGRRAFIGGTSADTPSTILANDPPPFGEFRDDAPEALRSLVARCLAKRPENRFQSADDVTHELAALSVEPAAAKGARRFLRSAVAVALGATLGAVMLAVLWFWPRSQPRNDLSAAVLTSYSGTETQPSFSPDGSKVAFVWNGDGAGNEDIYVKQVGSSGPPMRLTTSAAAEASPAWSPDDRWIAFTRARPDQRTQAIVLLSPHGGPEHLLAEAAGFSGLSWTPDGKWLAFSKRDAEPGPMSLWAIQVESGEGQRPASSQLTGMGPGNTLAESDLYPAVSPDGRLLAFARGLNFVNYLYVLPVTPDLRPAGEARGVTDQSYGNITGVAWTPNSRDIVYSAGGFGVLTLWRVSVGGERAPTRLPFASPSASFPAISPGRSRLAYAWNLHNMNLWRFDMRTAQSRMLVGSTFRSEVPQYSPDGRKIAFQSNRSGTFEVWTCDADGSNCLQLTSFGGPMCGSPRWSPDGRWIAFDARTERRSEIYVIAAHGGSPQQLTRGTGGPRVDNSVPSWSPDGRWLFFTSNRTGREEIWKIPMGGGQAAQVTRSGGLYALSSPDGQHLYYMKTPSAGSLFRMPADGGEERQVVSRQVGWASFCVTAKGVYFLTDKSIDLLDPETGRVSTVTVLDQRQRKDLCVSPDGRYFIWSQLDRNSADLMLVENFR